MALTFGIAALGAAVLAGCSTASYTKGNAAAHTLDNAAAEVQAQSRDLDLTMSSLKALVNASEADLKKPFHKFSRDLDRFAASAQRVEATAKEMEQRHAVYLQSWADQIGQMGFEHLRDVSQARWLEVSNRFDTLDRRYQQNQSVVEPVISYLRDIRRALSTDLTTGGLQAIKDTVAHTDENAAKVQIALTALTQELLRNGLDLSTVARSGTNNVPGTAKMAKD